MASSKWCVTHLLFCCLSAAYVQELPSCYGLMRLKRCSTLFLLLPNNPQHDCRCSNGRLNWVVRVEAHTSSLKADGWVVENSYVVTYCVWSLDRKAAEVRYLLLREVVFSSIKSQISTVASCLMSTQYSFNRECAYSTSTENFGMSTNVRSSWATFFVLLYDEIFRKLREPNAPSKWSIT